MNRLLAITQSVLAGIVAGAISFLLVPPIAAQQTLVRFDNQGRRHEILMAADDPRVLAIQDQWSAYRDVRPTVELAVASWQRDLAAHYCDDATQDNLASHWKNLQQQADQKVGQTQLAMYRDRGPAPAIQLGAVKTDLRRPNIFWFAVIVGVTVGILFWRWNLLSPSVRVSGLRFTVAVEPDASIADSVPNEGAPSAQEAVCETKGDWFRVQPPVSVSARRLVLCSMILWLLVIAA